MSTTSVIIMIVCIVACVAEAKKFTRCDLAKELAKNKSIPKGDIKTYVCIAEGESGYNTKATNRNKNGSTDYGIFQINNNWWCKDPKKPGRPNGCKIPCSSLVDDKITDDIKCAVVIKKQQGFKAWVAWRNKCKGKNLDKYVKGCKF